MLDSLLADLAASGWTISWAYQYSLNHWRMTIIQEISVGEEQGTYFSYCADAPSFAEALEECLLLRNDAEFEEDQPISFAQAPTKLDLRALVRKHEPIQRRI